MIYNLSAFPIKLATKNTTCRDEHMHVSQKLNLSTRMTIFMLFIKTLQKYSNVTSLNHCYFAFRGGFNCLGTTALLV